VAKEFDGINNSWRDFLLAQPLFFVATAPSGSGGHVNLSPKGLDGTFAIIDEGTVAYLDLTGSGVETIAHLRDNGRIVAMFCAFDGPHRIVRLHGRGEVVLTGDPRSPPGRDTFPTPCEPVPGR
jgi:Pyridoxamine 5'-phosphate oxidase